MSGGQIESLRNIMLKNECPCKECRKRNVYCHSTCVDYKKWARLTRILNHKEKEARNSCIRHIDWNGGKYYS